MALDYMCIQTNVTSLRGHEDVNNPSENGAFIHGFYLEGAAWNLEQKDKKDIYVNKDQKNCILKCQLLML